MSNSKESKERREFRACVADVAKMLSQQEVEEIVYIEDLPMACLGTSALAVLWQLQMAGGFSCTDIDGLVQVLKRINRVDLVHKLKKHAAKKRKKRSDGDLAEYSALYVTLEARLEALIVHNISLRDQLTRFIEDAQEAGEKRVEGEVAAAKSTIDTEEVHRRLKQAKYLLKHKSPSPPLSDEEESSRLSRQSSDSSGEVQPSFSSCRSQPPHAVTESRRSSPKTARPSPQPRRTDPAHPAAVRSMAEVHQPAVTVEKPLITAGKLVTGRSRLSVPGTQKKTPLLPPNQKKSTGSETSAPNSDTAVEEEGYISASTGGTGGDYTDDSGFVDAKRYQRRPLEPTKPPAACELKPAYYKRLEVPNMDKVDYYTTYHRSSSDPPPEAEFDERYEPLTRDTGRAYRECGQGDTIYQNQ